MRYGRQGAPAESPRPAAAAIASQACLYRQVTMDHTREQSAKCTFVTDHQDFNADASPHRDMTQSMLAVPKHEIAQPAHQVHLRS